MINKNELRIGNWAIGNPNGNVFMFGDGASIDNFAEQSDPIPLTAEILEMCGAIDFQYHWKLGIIQLDWSSRVISTNHRYGISVIGYPHVKYFHQLQNLYFSLTEQELTLKP